MTEVLCMFCEQPITYPDDAYREVVGFTRRRGQGGANQIKRPEPTGRLACIVCIDYRPNQTEMFA